MLAVAQTLYKCSYFAIRKSVGVEFVIAQTAVWDLERLVATKCEDDIKGSCSAIHAIDYGI